MRSPSKFHKALTVWQICVRAFCGFLRVSMRSLYRFQARFLGFRVPGLLPPGDDNPQLSRLRTTSSLITYVGGRTLNHCTRSPQTL